MEEHSHIPRVEIDLPAGLLRLFSTLLAYGIQIDVPSGITVDELLVEFLKIDAAYLETSVQTILLNGIPVDNSSEHRIQTSSTIALSAALPGIFGAAFRKGGTFSPLRQKAENLHISSRNRPIEITIKLFNMVAAALGPQLLHRGIRIGKDDFLVFLKNRPDFKQVGRTTFRLDGEIVTIETLFDRLASDGPSILLSVRTA